MEAHRRLARTRVIAARLRGLGVGFGLALSLVLSACVEEPLPRSYIELMEDRIAREGVLIRCNADREATANDPECINARRAAATIAAKDDAGKRAQLEAQSDARRLAVRQREEARQQAERRSQVAARQDEQLAYNAQFEESTAAPPPVAVPTQPPPVVVPTQPPPIAVEPPPGTATDTDTGSVAPQPVLEPVELPRSTLTPLTTIGLPKSAKPIEYKPPQPVLEDIVVPDRPAPGR